MPHGRRQHARLPFDAHRSNIAKLVIKVQQSVEGGTLAENDDEAEELRTLLAPVARNIGPTNMALIAGRRFQDWDKHATALLAEVEEQESHDATKDVGLLSTTSLRVLTQTSAVASPKTRDGVVVGATPPTRTKTGKAQATAVKPKPKRKFSSRKLAPGFFAATLEDKMWTLERINTLHAQAEKKGGSATASGWKGRIIEGVSKELSEGAGPGERKVAAAPQTIRGWQTKVKKKQPLHTTGGQEYLSNDEKGEILLFFADARVDRDNRSVRQAIHKKYYDKCEARGDAMEVHVPMGEGAAYSYEKLILAKFIEGPGVRHQSQDRISAMASVRNAAAMYCVATSAQTLDNGLTGQDGMVRAALTVNVDKTTVVFDAAGPGHFAISIRVAGKPPNVHNAVATKNKAPPKTLPASVGVYPTITAEGELGPYWILISLSGSETQGVEDRSEIVIDVPKMHPRGVAAGVSVGAKIVISFGVADPASKARVAALEAQLGTASVALEAAVAAAAAAAAADAAPNRTGRGARAARRRDGDATAAAASTTAAAEVAAKEVVANLAASVAVGKKLLRPKDRRFFTELYLPELKKWIASLRAEERKELGLEPDAWDDRLTASFYLDGAINELKAIENACKPGSPLFDMFGTAMMRVIKIGARNTGNEQPLDVSPCFSVLKQLLRTYASKQRFSTTMKPEGFIVQAVDKANAILKQRQIASVQSGSRAKSVKKGFKGGRSVRIKRQLTALYRVASRAFVQSNVRKGWIDSGLLAPDAENVWRPNSNTIITRAAAMKQKRSAPMKAAVYTEWRVATNNGSGPRGLLMEKAFGRGEIFEVEHTAAGLALDADFKAGEKPNEQRPMPQRRMKIVNFKESIEPKRKEAQELAQKAAAATAAAAAAAAAKEAERQRKQVEKAEEKVAARARAKQETVAHREAKSAALVATREAKAAVKEARKWKAAQQETREELNMKAESRMFAIEQICVAFVFQCHREAMCHCGEDDECECAEKCHCADCNVGFDAFGNAASSPLAEEQRHHEEFEVEEVMETKLAWHKGPRPTRGEKQTWRCPVCEMGKERERKRRLHSQSSSSSRSEAEIEEEEEEEEASESDAKKEAAKVVRAAKAAAAAKKKRARASALSSEAKASLSVKKAKKAAVKRASASDARSTAAARKRRARKRRARSGGSDSETFDDSDSDDDMEKHQKKRQRRGGAGSSRASKGGSSSFLPPPPATKKTKRKRTKTKELLEVGDTVYYCPAFATNGSDTVPLRSVIVEIQIDAEDSPALVVTDHGHRLRCIDDVQLRLKQGGSEVIRNTETGVGTSKRIHRFELVPGKLTVKPTRKNPTSRISMREAATDALKDVMDEDPS